MAQSLTPEKKKFKVDQTEMTDVLGYIHNVSPIKISEKNNTYFTCSIQTETEVNEMVCLSPDNWKVFQKAEREDNGVVIRNVRCQQENRKRKLFSNYTTVISNVTEPLKFEKRQQLIEEIQIKDITIADAVLKVLDVCGSYCLTGKVINLSKPIEVMVYGIRKNCQNAVLTDGLHKINLAVYGNLVNNVETGRSYRFTNVAMRRLNNVNKLTSKKQTVIEETEYVLLGNLYDVGKNDTDCESLVIDVSGIKCDLKVKCPCCASDINYELVKHVPTIRCSKCDMLMKTAKLVSAMTTRIDGTQDNGVNQKVTVFNHAMREYLLAVDKVHLITDSKGLEEFILKQTGKMNVVIDNSNVKEISFDV